MHAVVTLQVMLKVEGYEKVSYETRETDKHFNEATNHWDETVKTHPHYDCRSAVYRNRQELCS